MKLDISKASDEELRKALELRQKEYFNVGSIKTLKGIEKNIKRIEAELLKREPWKVIEEK